MAGGECGSDKGSGDAEFFHCEEKNFDDSISVQRSVKGGAVVDGGGLRRRRFFVRKPERRTWLTCCLFISVGKKDVSPS